MGVCFYALLSLRCTYKHTPMLSKINYGFMYSVCVNVDKYGFVFVSMCMNVIISVCLYMCPRIMRQI